MVDKSKVQRWRRRRDSRVNHGVDFALTGLSGLFVAFIFMSILSAAIFRRDEVDWSPILGILVILFLFVIGRVVFEKRLAEETHRTVRRMHHERDQRIDDNVGVRAKAEAKGHRCKYDSDGRLYIVKEAGK